MTTIDIPTLTVAKPRPAADPRVWARLGAHAAELHDEAQGMRRVDRLGRAALGAFTVLRALGVHIDVSNAEKPSLLRAARSLKLTEREFDVLRGMADGKSNAEIGRELFVAEDTVKTHARRLFRKIGARDRAHAVSLGFRLELLT